MHWTEPGAEHYEMFTAWAAKSAMIGKESNDWGVARILAHRECGNVS